MTDVKRTKSGKKAQHTARIREIEGVKPVVEVSPALMSTRSRNLLLTLAERGYSNVGYQSRAYQVWPLLCGEFNVPPLFLRNTDRFVSVNGLRRFEYLSSSERDALVSLCDAYETCVRPNGGYLPKERTSDRLRAYGWVSFELKHYEEVEVELTGIFKSVRRRKEENYERMKEFLRSNETRYLKPTE